MFIVTNQVEFPGKKFDNRAKELIKKLLQSQPMFRYGCLKGGADDIKQHEFFNEINWQDLLDKKIAAPWLPPIKNPLDTSMFDEYDEDDGVDPFVDDGSGWFDEF